MAFLWEGPWVSPALDQPPQAGGLRPAVTGRVLVLASGQEVLLCGADTVIRPVILGLAPPTNGDPILQGHQGASF